ncbi:phage tail protein [Bordetella avium]|uniref:phage tail protein n=1 Tax=Bordetella avium TaxID=521 RepID=UPI000E68F460|nr:phage tail protein [Bordetella avium]RIQ74580.1 phage tail protein [Bordetella avium]
MEDIEIVGIGEREGDGKGDLLRPGMAKVNRNFARLAAAIHQLDLAAAAARNEALSAHALAAGAVPCASVGVAGGVASLNEEGLVFERQLGNVVKSSEKGVAGGVATLNEEGLVFERQLGNVVKSSEKGVAGGVATLNEEGLVFERQLGNVVKSSEKGVAGGVATLNEKGFVFETQLGNVVKTSAIGAAGGIPQLDLNRKILPENMPDSVVGLPMFMVAWCPNRAAIWPGYAPADGQLLPRALYPDAAANITGPNPGAPVVTDAQWLANPELRASFSLGDGSTTLRMPDYNGKSAGSLGAVVMRGDGALSAGVDGVIQRDALQNITGAFDPGVGNNGARMVDVAGSGVFTATAKSGAQAPQNVASATDRYVDKVTFDASRVARTAAETRALNATGCWVIRLFGAVANPGSADAAQLATDYAALASGLQALQAKVGSTLIYPNGGSAASPASLAINSRYVEANPFPGYRVSAVGEILVSGEWQQVGFSAYGGTQSLGIAVTQLQDGRLMVETGISAFVSALVLHGYSGATRPNITTPSPARVRVWKIGAA